MLKLLILVAVLVAGLECQNVPQWLQDALQHSHHIFDAIHGYYIQYDDHHDLIIVMGEHDCYLIDAPDSTWDAIAHHHHHHGTTANVSEAIYQQIVSGTGVTQITETQAQAEYHSHLEHWECRRKQIHKLSYSLS